MNSCTICDAKTITYVEAALASGKRSVLSVSKEFGISYDALRRHIANDHKVRFSPTPAVVAPTRLATTGAAPYPPKPEPDAVWEYSANEQAVWIKARDDWRAAMSRATGFTVEQVIACNGDEGDPPFPAGHDFEACPVCVATGTSKADEVLWAFVDFYESQDPAFTRGRWLVGAEAAAARAA